MAVAPMMPPSAPPDGPPPGAAPAGPPVGGSGPGAMPAPMMAGPGAGPPPGPPGPQDPNAEPSFDDAMGSLVEAIAPTLHPNDIKVLKKLTPDVAWVLSKVFGVKAVSMLTHIGVASNAPAGQNMMTPDMGMAQPTQ